MDRPRARPLPLLNHRPRRLLSGTQIGHIKNGKIVLTGTPLTTTPDPSSPITPYTTTQPAPPATGVPSN